ncbi:MAG: cysteine--tRNA ligase [Thermoproteota archaeon]|nr:cysteine--tRNA ligase [Thermoproteota archaeon]
MRIFNTLTNEVENVALSTDKSLKIYICGVTVYDDCHMGHARTIIIFDVLRRFLLSKNYKIDFIQNFTDVDDKIIDRAKKEGVNYCEISNRYIESYFKDFDSLNVLRANIYPKVTEHISEIIDFIDGLKQKNMAYIGINGIYYRVRFFPEYGKLSKKNNQSIESGARIEVDTTKDDPRDFALWKFSGEDPMWKSPWGPGRPGWHIECSAMAIKYLGTNIDIHGGGQDLVFPHHENEIAQSEGFKDKPFAKLWMHVGMVTIKSEKMSKSIGNIIRISELTKKYNPNVIRLFCLLSHYSKPLDYSEDIMVEIQNKWRSVINSYYEVRFRIENTPDFGGNTKSNNDLFKKEVETFFKDFEKSLEDDLNFANAMTHFYRFVNKLNNAVKEDTLDNELSRFSFEVLEKFMYVLGLKINYPLPEKKQKIEELLHKRNVFRKQKNFHDSDKIRNDLLINFDVELMDHKGFTVWKTLS